MTRCNDGVFIFTAVDIVTEPQSSALIKECAPNTFFLKMYVGRK